MVLRRDRGHPHERMTGKATKGQRPRAIGGGRSNRYDERRASRGTRGSCAPAWSDAAAKATLDELHNSGKAAGHMIVEHTLWVLSVRDRINKFTSRLKGALGPHDREVVTAIMREHMARVSGASTDAGRKAKAKAFLKPLRERASVRGGEEPLVVAPAAQRQETFHDWLASEPEKERQRDISKCNRLTAGLARWPKLPWLDQAAVVCFERGEGRVRKERGGKPDAGFLRGVVKTTALPTAVANPADHYVVIEPKKPPRFMTVEEVARSFGVSDKSPLCAALFTEEAMTAVQAVACLGRSIHVGVARQLLRMLRAEGLLPSGLLYGSAFSGIDTFAAAVDEELEGDWTYSFASERDETARRGLAMAWAARGLQDDMIYRDARAAEAAGGPRVDLYVTTPTCEKYSRRNHRKTATGQHLTLGEVWDSLRYVREKRPRVVVMENVSEPEAIGPMTGLLSRLEGYRRRTAPLDPRTTAGAPTARERQFWVLVAEDDE